MNLSKQSGETIIENLQNYIDRAAYLDDLEGLLQITPLETIKSCLKNHVTHLENQLNISSNTNNTAYNNPRCASQYNKLRQLTISISPITDILPYDIMKYILSFITLRKFYDIKTNRYYKFLPVLSKQFQSIMNDVYFYDSKYPLYIHDNIIKKVRKSKKTENETYDPSAIHIYADHNKSKLHIMHLKDMKFKSTKTIKKISKLSPSNVFQSLLPWKNRHKLCILNEQKYRYALNKENANLNIVNVLNELKQVKYLEIEGSIVPWRINAYPRFANVVCLSILCNRFFAGGQYNYNCLSTQNLNWLNQERFPSLKILSIAFDQYNIASNPQTNLLINALNLSSLELKATKLRKWKVSSNLEFFRLASNSIDELDLSECNKLIGIKLPANIAFSKIKWNKNHSMSFINIQTIGTYFLHQTNNAYEEKRKKWLIAYQQEKIPTHISIGSLFFGTKHKSKKYLRKQTMNFDKIIVYVNDSNAGPQTGWEKIYKQCFKVYAAQFVQTIAT